MVRRLGARFAPRYAGGATTTGLGGILAHADLLARAGGSGTVRDAAPCLLHEAHSVAGDNIIFHSGT
jgi:hypothetical protein